METTIFDNLKKAILEYDSKASAEWAQKAMDEKLDPVKVMDAMTEAIQIVGEGFGRDELFLPELVGAGEAMEAATPIIEAELKRTGAKRESAGTVVLGTVFGDMHNIGKSMVATMLITNGFEVVDLGINVESGQFIKAVKEHNADIVAMSALLTTTVQEQKNVIEALIKEGLRDKVKVMVGGGAISHEFADKIGADGFAPSAPGAAELARQLLGN